MVAAVIVLGIDPGAVDTGLAVVDLTVLTATPPLLDWFTVHRAGATKGREMTRPPRSYLRDVLGAAVGFVNRYDVELIAVEGVNAPGGHAAGRKGHLINPGAIIATGIVFGAVFGRSWSCECVAVTPGGNGNMIPLNRYPAPLGTTGKGNDKHRHERSAYDVAIGARSGLRFVDAGGYGP